LTGSSGSASAEAEGAAAPVTLGKAAPTDYWEVTRQPY